ncbi:lysophospholipid acyltransferase family protein [Mumia sp. ZJ430]|uniref:lysophospholipid acyltransferase family protein n=1 Tax=Mumia sp. ZJ430 TaxID=2708083 RepID=UPI001FB92BB3|nr:lysophospholipid acyltransferase family protein [Mumia sp. ZJ430]
MADVPKDDAPLGTRGRPGRGTGKATPSSAARSLAGPAKKTAAKKTAAKKTAAAKPAKKTTEAAGSPVEPETSAVQIAPKVDVPPIGSPVELISVTPQEMPSPPESPEPPEPEPVAPRLELIRNDGEDDDADASTPPTGIPLSDWVSALTEGAQSVLGEDWESKAAQLLAQLRRRLTGDYEIDSFGLDPQLHAIGMAALRPIAEKWFRIEVRGAERIPSDGGALVVANHSGTIPVDAAMTTLVVNDHAHRTLRLLGADLVFTLPFVGELARKMGATLACSEDAERLLAEGHIVAVWPEGFKGVGKPYSERYKLQRFGRGGFVSAAMRAGVPIVPVSIVGAEEIYPLVGNVPSLARLLGLPYMPITPFFPWLGPLGMIPLPSKWIIEFGDPIRTDAYPPEAADDPMLVFNVTDQVRETIQQTLYALLVDRGHPFI